jgi:hypothetical protein
MRDLTAAWDEPMTPSKLEAYFTDSAKWEGWEGCDKDGAPLVQTSLLVNDFEVVVHLIADRWDWSKRRGLTRSWGC